MRIPHILLSIHIEKLQKINLVKNVWLANLVLFVYVSMHNIETFYSFTKDFCLFFILLLHVYILGAKKNLTHNFAIVFTVLFKCTRVALSSRQPVVFCNIHQG